MKIKAKEITPKQFRCVIGACPTVFETNRGTLIIVGSVPAGRDLPRNIRGKMGRGETAVEVPLKLFQKS